MGDSNDKQKQAMRKSIRSSAGIWLCSTSLFALAGAMTPGAVHAQAWTGATSQDWLTANNWNPNFLPVNLADIAISTAKYPIIDGVAASVGTVKVGAFPLVLGAKAKLDIVNGGKLSSSTGVIADLDSQVGVVSVSGPGSLWNNSAAMAIGKGGAGDLLVSGGGQVKSNSITVAELVGTGSTLSVDGAGSKVTSANQLMLGGQSAAYMYVKNGGTVGNGYAEIAQGVGTHSYAWITGKDSRWDSSGGLIVGNAGTATLEVSNAGQISSLYSALAADTSSYAITTVSGAGSRWDNTQFLKVGVRGTAYLNIEQGAVVTNTDGTLGLQGSSLGKVEIHDASSRWDNTGSLTVGLAAWGLLYIHDAAVVTSLDGTIASDLSGKGRVDVTKGGSWTMTDGLTVAQSGSGRLFVNSGGQVSNKTAVIALKAAAKGEVTVQDAGSLWTSSAALTVAAAGDGSLQVLDGGQVRSLKGAVAYDASSLGHVVVSGAGSRWDNTQTLTVGVYGMGEMAVQQGAAVTSMVGRIGDEAGSNSLVSVEGAGSTWKNTSALFVGVLGQGTLRIAEGGLVESAGATIGFGAGGKGRVEIMADINAGTPAKWINSGDLVVGNLGEGILALRTNSQLTVTGGDIVIAQQAGGTGKLIIGTELGESQAGQLTAPRIRFGSGDGALVFNHESTDYVFATTIQGKGVIAHQKGSTIYTGNGGAFTGTTTVSGGMLRVNGTLGGTVDVQSGGTLGGIGFLGGAVTVATSGTLLGSSGQTLTMGSLALNAGSNVNVALGAPGNITGLFKVGGNLTLAGTLNVADAGGFGQGVYRIFDYSGLLTDNGMTVGTIPAGTGTIQTAMANQVNLVVDAGGPVPAVQFWNGTTMVADGTIHGGNGIWSASPATNWTDVNGMVASPWAGTFAVFQNNPGNVTVDASAGVVSTTGMQFIGTGWAVAGAPITLSGSGGNTALRVGDGTLGGAAYSATIGAELTGNSRLVKDDLGTLILIGTNSYTGGTTIAAGTLQIGNGSMVGAMSGDVLNNGTLAFNRSDVLTFAGTVGGSGSIRQIGAGTVTLTGNSGGFTGTTRVESGTLAVNGQLGGSFSVLSGGTLAGTGNVGTVSVANGGTLSGVQGQTLTTGGLTLAAGSNVNVALGVPGNATGLFKVGGNLTLAGMLNVADAGGFGQGVYRIFDYSGSLTDNGMTVSTIPTGTGTIQTAMSNQVNLVVETGGPVPAAQFWNGTTTEADGTIHGGSGIWSAGPATNWTGTNGATASAWAGTFAVFQNNPGNVTVDSSAGAISTTGMQFIGTGWAVAGGPITLNGTGGSTMIRVGDSTVAGAGFTATIASALTGTSGLVKGDLGTLILTGANTYTGGTTIEAGTLWIGNGGTTGSVIGNVANSGTLAFNRSNDLTFAGVISGTGAIRQIGSGMTMLTGDSSGFTGTTQVEAGILSVNGKLGGAINVFAAGRLQGIGTVGDVAVAGTIAPGNSIGTLNVGNITFQAGSIYQVEVNANGQSDKIVAAGTATINGGSVQVLAGQGSYQPNTTYTILTAAGGRTGTFGGVSSNLAFLAPSLSYDPDNVYLTLTRNTVSFPSIGGTFNQRQAGAGTESLGQGNPIWNAVVQMDAPTAQAAFNQLSGEVHASAKTALYEDSRLVRDGALSRLRSAFGGNISSASTAQVVSVDEACGTEACQADPGTGITAWAQGFGSWGYTSTNGNAAGLSRSTGGMLVGVDAPLFEVARLGLFGGYSHTNFNVADRQSAGGSDNVHLGAYGGAQWGPIGLRAGLAYTWHNLSTSRSVAFPGFADNLRATYGAGTFQLFGEAGYRFEVGQASFEPFANIAWMSLSTKGFSETGGAAALTSSAVTSNVTTTTVGLRAGSAFTIAGMTGQARGTVGWQHAFTDTTPWASLQLAGGTPFTAAGVPIAQDAALLELGIDVRLSERASIGIGYTGQFAAGAQDQSVRGNFTFRF